MWGLLKKVFSSANSRAIAVARFEQRTCKTGAKIVTDGLEYIPLPRAPLQWQTSQTISTPDATDEFEVREADWRIKLIEKLAKVDRPDPAYRNAYPGGSCLFMIDDLGKAAGLGTLKSAAMVYDGDGRAGANVGFHHDVYRTGVHALGNSMVVMSRDCTLHAYDDRLRPIVDVDLAQVPEVVGLRQKFGIPRDKLKNYLRCVALSAPGTRYLFTAVDEAFCQDLSGRRLWSTKLPIKAGWARVATPRETVGTSDDVQRALLLMGLSLPVTPEQLKSRYRELAKSWHPDLNPGDPRAASNMQALTAAMESLTGIDASELPSYTGDRYEKVLSRQVVDVDGVRATVSMSMAAGELFVLDWIYAAAFAASSDAAYVAGYSGKVFALDGQGQAQRVYDIGSVPSQIVDTGDFLYLLTATRLYVLRGNALHALIDVYGAGKLMISGNGFGLLQTKALRWYAKDGRYLGMITTKDPIRLVYQRGNETIVETRQRRAVIDGGPTWW